MKRGQEADKGWLIPYMKQYSGPFAIAALLSTIAVICAGALLFTSGYLISRSALRPENVLMVYVPIVLVRTFGFSKAIFQYAERLVGHNAALHALARMRVKLYRFIEPQALSLRSRYRTGDLLQLLSEDTEQLQNVYLRIVLPAVTAVLVYSAGIAALGRMDGIFALWMALYCGFLLFAAPAVSLWISLSKRRQFKQQRKLIYQELTDAMFGMSDWVLSGRTGHLLNTLRSKQSSAATVEKKLRRYEWRIEWLTRSATGAAVVMLAVWAGGLAASHRVEATWIAALTLVAFPLLDALVRVADAVQRIPDYQDSLQRLGQVEKDGRAVLATRTAVASSAAEGQKPFDAGNAELRLDRVGYRYPQADQWSVRDVSLTLPPGHKLAVLGRSGAGKSTLLSLILGEQQPQEGSVTVNDRPVAELDSACFSVLNQKPYLFDTTVANNIRLGRSDATDEEVRRVIGQVGLSRLIESLPNGFHTRMEEAGSRFSGGERQRIALARVLLQNHPVVLLDEPTVGLDPLTESELIDTIFQVLEGKTMIWFTHHLTGVQRMDEVVFMDRGRISMRGRHDELIRNEERYRRLYELDHV